MKAHGLDKEVAKLLADPRLAKDAEYRAAELTKLREAIAAKPLNADLKKALAARLARLPLRAGRGAFVRADAVGEAVKKVWASVWNKRAFEERTHFGIDHKGVYGAVLVQVGVDATAAGVLITANIFDREDKNAYTINAKSGLGMRVVEGKRIPEQLLFDTSNYGIKVMSRSDEDTMLVFDKSGGVKEVPNPNKGKPVLTDERAMRLALSAKAMTRLFPPDKPLDVEWLFEDDTLFIVQSRPYIGL
jgi:phosphoenolpyruvate synthase/pyruvate phosphate dikinase